MVVGRGTAYAFDQKPVVTGIAGWLKRMIWKRAAGKMSDEQVSEMRKHLIIVEKQLANMPVTSSLSRRRLELLIEQERCRIMITTWEQHPA